ncbi:MAG: flavin reductase family protein [Bacteroidales bacterium]|nr:flavin reductase family protein [Bacteroidales bacterium]
MKKNIGVFNAAFPTPICVVGAMVAGKPAWFEVAWTGIGDANVVTLSVTATHYTCDGIRAEKALSVNFLDEDLIPRADYVGIVSGAKVDKSGVFDWTPASNGAPLIDDAPVSMALDLLDIYDANGCYLLICKVRETFAREELLNDKGKLDFAKYKPVLFEPGFHYLRTGDIIEPCVVPGKAFEAEQGID